MKKMGLIIVIILLIGVIATFLLVRAPQQNVHLLKLKGVTFASNYSKNSFAYTTLPNADNITSVPATGNDLIYAIQSVEDDLPLVYYERKQKDKLLDLKFDSLGTYQDGRLISINIADDNGSSDWINKSSAKDIRFLQSVFISDSINDTSLQAVKKMGESNSDLGLIIDEEVNNLSDVIKFLRPVWVFAPDIELDANAFKELYQLDKLELLAAGHENLDMTKLDGLSKLKTLYISNMDSSSLDRLNQLPQGLLSLHMIDSDLKDLDFLKGKPHIKELTLSGCESLADISAIKSLDNLQVLSLTDCESIADLTPLHGLKELKWLSPPCNISDKELELIVRNSPGIESVDLCHCKNLNGLNAVKDLRKLSYLTLVETAIPTDSLVKLQDLKYLAYNTGQPGDSINILHLQSQMPNTMVVAAEPFCMGTGWLLVFFVLMVMLAIVSLAVKKRIIV